MRNIVQNFGGNRVIVGPHFSTVEWLGILIGIAMPVVSSLAYPTYMHMMQTAWVEWSRLLEAPFVLCEIFVILWACCKGMDSLSMWRSMPADVKTGSILLIIGVFGSSLFVSDYPLKSLTISLITIVHFLFGFAIYHLLRRSSILDFKTFIFLLGAGLITLALLTFVKFLLPPPASAVPGGVIEWDAALPGFISVRHFGSWTGAVAAGFLAMLLYRDDTERISIAHAFYFLSAAMTVWSGTRAAILAIAVVTMLLVLMRWKLPSFRNIGIIALTTGAATTAAWLMLPDNQPNFLLFVPSDIVSANQLTSGRYDLWAASLKRWGESPFWGLGSGSQFWEVYLGWPQTQPHNVIVQFLISWGLVGAVPALWLIARAIFRAHTIVMGSESLQPLIAVLYTLLLMSLVEGMLHYPRFIMLVIIMFAAILAHDANSREKLSPI